MNLFDLKSESLLISSLVNEFVPNSESFVLIDEDDFFEPVHRFWFSQLKGMYESGGEVSPSTFLARLRLKDGTTESRFIETLGTYSPSPAATFDIAKMVKNFSLLRKLQDLSKVINSQSSDPVNDPLELIEKYTDKLLSFSGFTKTDQPELIRDLMHSVVEKIDKIRSGQEKTFGITTGIDVIDECTGGFEDGQLYVVAARPSVGKTSLMLTIVKNISTHIPTVIFSLEMTSEQIGLRLLSQICGISYYNLKNGNISMEDSRSYMNSAAKISDYRLHIDPTSNLSVYELRSKLNKLKRDNGTRIVFIDYLGLMNTPKLGTRDLEIGYITKNLKSIAKEENMPIVLLCQLNRGVEDRADKRPILRDLRESGNIEQDADVVIFIHRDRFLQGETKIGKEPEIIIGKNRNGKIGAREVVFLEETMDFKNKEEKRVELSQDRPKK